MNWYYAREGRQVGPLSEQDLKLQVAMIAWFCRGQRAGRPWEILLSPRGRTHRVVAHTRSRGILRARPTLMARLEIATPRCARPRTVGNLPRARAKPSERFSRCAYCSKFGTRIKKQYPAVLSVTAAGEPQRRGDFEPRHAHRTDS